MHAMMQTQTAARAPDMDRSTFKLHVLQTWTVRRSNCTCSRHGLFDVQTARAPDMDRSTFKLHVLQTWTVRRSNCTCSRHEPFDVQTARAPDMDRSTFKLHVLQTWTVRRSTARASDMDRSTFIARVYLAERSRKELTVCRAQMSETPNETNRVELSGCTLPNFEKCAAKIFYHGDQMISWWRICRRERSTCGIHLKFGCEL